MHKNKQLVCALCTVERGAGGARRTRRCGRRAAALKTRVEKRGVQKTTRELRGVTEESPNQVFITQDYAILRTQSVY